MLAKTQLCSVLQLEILSFIFENMTADMELLQSHKVSPYCKNACSCKTTSHRDCMDL